MPGNRGRDKKTARMDSYRITDFALFSGLNPEDAESLQNTSFVRKVAAGTRIFDAGEPAQGLYLVLSGSVKIFKVSAKGTEQVMAVLGPHQTFAEAPVFHGGFYPANAETLEACELILIQRDALLALLCKDSEMALRMMAGMAMKLRKLVALVEDLTLRDARGRVARYLAGLAEEGQNSFQLPVQQSLLARMLGLTGETLSRTMKGLRDEGVIESSLGGRIQVANWSLLHAAAGDTD